MIYDETSRQKKFSVTTKFFVIKSSSKILNNELFEQDQWFSFQELLEVTSEILVDDEVSEIKNQRFLSKQVDKKILSHYHIFRH